MPGHNTVFHSPEENNKTKLIGLMAVCMEHIICNTANRLFISSTKLQHNVIIKSE
jgi:hypothetical protein